MGTAQAAQGQEENLKLCYNFELFFFSTHKIDLMGKIIYFTSVKNQTQNISNQILEKN